MKGTVCLLLVITVAVLFGNTGALFRSKKSKTGQLDLKTSHHGSKGKFSGVGSHISGALAPAITGVAGAVAGKVLDGVFGGGDQQPAQPAVVYYRSNGSPSSTKVTCSLTLLVAMTLTLARTTWG